MKYIYKTFLLLFILSLFATSIEEIVTINSKATALFKENGVLKYNYSNMYQLNINHNTSLNHNASATNIISKKLDSKEALWLSFQSVSKPIVGMGEFVRYSLKVENHSEENIPKTLIEIKLPKDFRYADDSYRVDEKFVKKSKVKENQLLLTVDNLQKSSSKKIDFILQVGVASRKQATVSAIATATGIISNRAVQIITIKNSELMRGKSTIVGQVLSNGTPVKNVKIYMEDGTFTLTDDEGRYNFLGIEDGTHVVQLDTDSLSLAYEIGSCEKSVRFAKSKVSQFVKTFSGTLHRSDFCLNVKDEYKENIRLFPKFASLDDKLDDVAKETIGSELMGVNPLNIASIIVEGHSDSQKIRAGNKFKNNYDLALARAKSVKQYISEYLNIELDKIKVISYADKKSISSNRTKEGRAKNRRVELSIIKIRKDGDENLSKSFFIEKKSVIMPKYDEIWLGEQSDTTEFIWPSQEFVPSTSAVSLAVKHKEEYRASYMINGEIVDIVHFERKISDDKGKSITVYRGVHLKEGDNLVVCEIKDDDGKVIKRLKKSVHYSTMPVRAEIVREYSNLVADGKQIPVIAVKFFDKDGYPVRGDVIGKFKISQPYRGYKRLDALGVNPLSKSTTGEDYVIGDGGIAYIRLETTTKAGEATLSLPFDNRVEELKIWLKPKVRDWILVGFAEGSLGYSTINNHMEDGKFDNKGEVSLFAKGKILGSYLMTIAYSSRREERELLDIIDPSRYYTIYGDSSIRGVEAPSQDKLYLKIEKDNFYAMFGDFLTGINDMKLSTYERTLNGIKGEYNSERIQTKFFGSNSDQSFVKDEIRGDGTSGLYRLSNQKIVIGSEKVTIETRDRFQPDRVIRREPMTPMLDYNIDYYNGTVYFKKPIFSRDREFNDIYIVVNYEMKSKGKNMTVGARVSTSLFDNRMKLSSTYIKEDLGEKNGQLASVDMRLNIGEKGKLEVEYAKSVGSQTVGQQDALRVEYEHNGQDFYTKAYYKKVDKGFGLKQQNAEDLDLEKIGIESNYKINTYTEVESKIYRDKKLSTGQINDIAQTMVKYNKQTVQIEGGARYINEHDGKEPTEQVIAGVSKSFFDNDLTLRARREESIKTSDSEKFANKTLLGAEYQVTENSAIFVEQEFIEGVEDKQITKVGFASEPWSGARVQTSIGNKIGDGDRLFSLAGIQQSLQLDENLNLDLGLDRSETLKGDTRDDFTSYSSSINYYKESLTSSLKVEYKQTNEQDSISLAVALATEFDSGLEMASTAQYLKSTNGDEILYTDISLVDRPFDENYIVLDKFHFIDERSGGLKSRRFVNDFNFNYKLTSTFELSLYHGIKYLIDTIDKRAYTGITQMFGFSGIYDINRDFDMMIYTNLIEGASTLDQQKYNHGIALGWNAYKNVNLLLGYNFEGFEDRDFNSGTETKEGVYIGFRMKFE